MTRPERHRIQRQVVDLVVSPASQAPSLQEALARSFRAGALADLQEVFDQAAQGRGTVRIEHLEVDLGHIRGRDWETQLRQRLVTELAHKLSELRATAAPAAAGGVGPLEQFLFFLRHGRLPWWAASVERGWVAHLGEHMDARGWEALRMAIRSDAVARGRCVQSAGDDFLQAAVALWCGLPHAAQALACMAPPGPHAVARAWRREGWEIVLQWALRGAGQGENGERLVRELLVLRDALGAPPPAPGAGGKVADATMAEPDLAALAQDLPPPWRAWMAAQAAAPPATPASAFASRSSTSVAPATAAAPAPAQGRSPGAHLSLVPGASAQHAAGAAVERRRSDAAEEAIYLPGAGAILLHPFLPELFRACGLLEGRGFRDAAARDRAVQLLGLLTFGTQDAPEYELLLPKLLCGCACEELVEAAPLDDADRARCDALLQAVLHHWSALRSSSPAWLRSQFFLREGKLETVDEGVRLTVERRAQDVLLARLPWGIGVIALPWLRQRVFVHWLD